MLHYSIFEVKAKLSEYAGLAAIGCEVMLTKYGKPFAKLVPVTAEDCEVFAREARPEQKNKTKEKE